MSEYQIGKDVKNLENRMEDVESAIKAITKSVSKQAPCSTLEVKSSDSSESSQMLDGVLARSKSYSWKRADVGRCAWDEYTVTFFDNGRVVYNGTVDCNEPLFYTCTFTHVISAVLSDGGLIEALRWSDELGGVTRDQNENQDVFSGAIRDAFDKIVSASASYNCRCIDC
jgi:hypothetical protein